MVDRLGHAFVARVLERHSSRPSYPVGSDRRGLSVRDDRIVVTARIGGRAEELRDLDGLDRRGSRRVQGRYLSGVGSRLEIRLDGGSITGL